MKKICLIIITICLLLFAGCKAKYSFLHDNSQITTIEIVQVEYDENGIPEFIVLSLIEDKETFLEDFSQVSCYLKSPPSGIEDSETAIKITYVSEEYELISSKGNALYRYGIDGKEKVFLGNNGTYKFDETEFNALTAKYSK